MAATLITATAVPQANLAGLNLTDATYSTLSTGAGNGVKFTPPTRRLVVFKNDTGGTATFTVTIPVPTSISSVGGTITSPTFTLANNKSVIIPLPDSAIDPSTGYMTITCDVAGKVLVLDL